MDESRPDLLLPLVVADPEVVWVDLEVGVRGDSSEVVGWIGTDV